MSELANIFKPNGGYVFNCVHNIMGNVSPESIVAVYGAAYENSWTIVNKADTESVKL